MAGWQAIASVILGLAIIAGLTGWNQSDEFLDIPKPTEGVCAVQKEALEIPSSSTWIDIKIDLKWTEEKVWIGIISEETYSQLEKGSEVEGVEIIPCPTGGLDFVAGGPGTADQFSWEPDGSKVHVMIGGPEGNNDGGEDDNTLPPPFGSSGEENSKPPFEGYFDIFSSAEIEAGMFLIWGLIVIEIGILMTTRLK